MSNSASEKKMTIADIDKNIHEPARLLILSLLREAEEVDFLFLQTVTGFTQGNLSSHIARLEEAGYVAVKKMFAGKKPRTIVSITKKGRKAFDAYRTLLREFLA